jgi:flavin-dependent dehydrogenase
MRKNTIAGDIAREVLSRDSSTTYAQYLEAVEKHKLGLKKREAKLLAPISSSWYYELRTRRQHAEDTFDDRLNVYLDYLDPELEEVYTADPEFMAMLASELMDEW